MKLSAMILLAVGAFVRVHSSGLPLHRSKFDMETGFDMGTRFDMETRFDVGLASSTRSTPAKDEGFRLQHNTELLGLLDEAGELKKITDKIPAARGREDYVRVNGEIKTWVARGQCKDLAYELLRALVISNLMCCPKCQGSGEATAKRSWWQLRCFFKNPNPGPCSLCEGIGLVRLGDGCATCEKSGSVPGRFRWGTRKCSRCYGLKRTVGPLCHPAKSDADKSENLLRRIRNGFCGLFRSKRSASKADE